MGIPGLTAFMKKNFHSWECQTLEGHLVIDGGSLHHYLYTFQWNHGGEYPQYRAAVIDMFNTLLQANIRPVVVFDGVDYNRDKKDTTLKRRRESIKFVSENLTRSNPSSKKVLPLLTKEVCQLTLKELKIPFYVADGEADSLVVEVANFYKCPVLGSDSDYFIFNIERGYIPIEHFDWKTSTRPISCKVFRVSRFLEQFNIKHEGLLFAIPGIIGNDCLSSLFSDRLVRHLTTDRECMPRAQRVARLVRCLGQYSSTEVFIQRLQGAPQAGELEVNYHKAREIYDCTKQTDPESFLASTGLKTAQKEAIPSWIIGRFRQGDLSRHCMSVIVLGEVILKICPDDSRKPSSSYASLSIRQKLYYLLNTCTVTEITREGLYDLAHKGVESLPIPTASSQVLSPYPLQALCEVLDCQLSSFRELGEEWKLVAMATRYWAEVTSAQAHLVEALVYCQIVCCTCTNDLDKLRQKCVSSSSFQYTQKWRTALHAFAQWQCCYMNVLSVNQLLSSPLKVISPALLYDGTIAMFMAEDVSKVPASFPVDSALYHIMCSVVLQNRSPVSSEKARGKNPGQPTVDKKHPQSKPSSRFEHKNPFFLLQTETSDSGSSCDSD